MAINPTAAAADIVSLVAYAEHLAVKPPTGGAVCLENQHRHFWDGQSGALGGHVDAAIQSDGTVATLKGQLITALSGTPNPTNAAAALKAIAKRGGAVMVEAIEDAHGHEGHVAAMAARALVVTEGASGASFNQMIQGFANNLIGAPAAAGDNAANAARDVAFLMVDMLEKRHGHRGHGLTLPSAIYGASADDQGYKDLVALLKTHLGAT